VVQQLLAGEHVDFLDRQDLVELVEPASREEALRGVDFCRNQLRRGFREGR
jgi:hypothetical protein